MEKRKSEIQAGIYHVRRCGNRSWRVEKEGFNRPHFTHQRKEEAILLAKRLAKLSLRGTVVIHMNDDEVERRLNYDFRHADFSPD